MAVKPLSNTVNIGTASNVYKATAVYVVNSTGSPVTANIANTGIDTGTGQHGNYEGSRVQVLIPGNMSVVIRKRPMDTIAGTGLVATKVPDAGA
jgi:hypothetical protein